MKKTLLALTFCALASTACNPPTPAPEPEPDEYFSFYADGEYYFYPQIYESGLFAADPTLQAFSLGATSYLIRGRQKEFPTGSLSLFIPGGHIPDSDTVILTSAGIQDLGEMSNSFEMDPPLLGRVIFTERSSTRLTGTFEFDAYHVNFEDTSGKTITDTIIHITDGKFSIIPS